MSAIGVIGWGVVGQATGKAFMGKGQNVVWHDKYKKSGSSLSDLIEKSEFIFVCVPTPMQKAQIDLSIVDSVVDAVAPKLEGTKKVLVLKSTVIPGTTVRYSKKYKGVNFAMNPEFLTEKNAMKDFLNADRTIIGVFKKGVGSRLKRLYQGLYGKDALIFVTDPTSAELTKYMANTFLATKVIFANEFFEMCAKMGVEYDQVRDMMVADSRIGESHLGVTSKRGFGGKCFPKDTVALLGKAKELEVDLSLLKAAWKKNLKIRKDYDWEEIEGAVSKKN